MKKSKTLEVDGYTGDIEQKMEQYMVLMLYPIHSDIKSGIKRTLSALNNNFHAFWNFQIVQDSLTLNIKVIDHACNLAINWKILQQILKIQIKYNQMVCTNFQLLN